MASSMAPHIAEVVHRQSVQVLVRDDASEDLLSPLRNVPASTWVH